MCNIWANKLFPKALKSCPKWKKIAQSGHTDGRRCDTQEEERLFRFRSFLIFAKTFLASKCALTCFFLKKWAITDLFLFIFVLFKHKFLQKKTVDFSGIRTRIVGVECKHADHLTTTAAMCFNFLVCFSVPKLWQPMGERQIVVV